MVSLRKSVYTFRRILFRIVSVLNNLVTAVLMLMVLLLVTDVVLRRVFNNPFSWSLEVVKVMLVVVVSFAVVYCATRGGHISIDLLTSRFPKKVQAVLDPIIYLFGTGLFAFISWGTSVNAIRVWESYRITGVLPIPIYPFVLVLALGSALLALVLLLQFIDSIIHVESE